MTKITIDTKKVNNKGVIHLALPLFLLLAVAGFIALFYFGVIKNPFKTIPFLQKGPKVELKSQYSNPFKQDTQYVNPFETYKNPFTVAK